jgi:hypothetical protein
VRSVIAAAPNDRDENDIGDWAAAKTERTLLLKRFFVDILTGALRTVWFTIA